MSPSIQHNVHRNMSAPSSPVHNAKLEHRALTSHAGDGLHHLQQPSFPHAAETLPIHTSTSDHGRYADTRRFDVRQVSSHGDRSRVDRDYTDYAYVRAAGVTHPQTRDAFVDYRAGGNRGTDGVYVHSQCPSQWAETPREVEQRINSHRAKDGNLYHIASKRTVSYASSEELRAPVPVTSLPVTAAATSLRFLDPTPYWPSKHGSMEGGGYWRQNGGAGIPDLYSGGGGVGAGNSPYRDSDSRLPGRMYDALPPPRQLGSSHVRYETPPHLRAAAADSSCSSVELSPTDPSTVVMRGQNCVEVSKPFEMADVYKYSSRVRRPAADGGVDRSTDLRSTSSPHLTHFVREPPYRDRPAYVAPSSQYPPSRLHRKPVFD